MELNLADILISVLIFVFFIRGYQSGFINQVTTILGIAVGIYLAINNYEYFAEILVDNFNLTIDLARLVSFIAVVIVVSVVVSYLGYLLDQATNLFIIATIDNLAGAVFGLVKGFLIVYILLLVSINLPIENIQNELDESYLTARILSFNPIIEEQINRFVE